MLSSKMILNDEEFVLLREYIQKECGLVVGDESASLIQGRLARLVTDTQSESFRELYLKARADETRKLRNKIIEAMTTHETSWFRDPKTWDTLRDHIIPALIADVKKGRKKRVQVWSAGAGTGQEPYSFAMLLFEALQSENEANISHFRIMATDVSPSALFMASSGRYDEITMSRGMIPAYQARFFQQNGGIFQINPEIRQMVMFKQADLTKNGSDIPPCDLVLCRNVIGGFPSEIRRKLLRKIYDNMNEDGYLVLGVADNLLSCSEDFVQHSHQNTVYYKPKKQ